MSGGDVDIKSAMTAYPTSALGEVLRVGCDGVFPKRAEGNDNTVFVNTKPDGGFLHAAFTPSDRVIVTNVLKDFADASGTGVERLDSFLTEVMTKNPKLVAIPLLLPQSEHYVSLVAARRLDGSYNLIVFNPKGINARHAKELAVYQNAAIKALGGAQKVAVIHSQAVIQTDEVSCGPYVADFIAHAAANPDALAQPGFSPEMITDRLAASGQALLDRRALHSEFLAEDVPEEDVGKLIRSAKLPGAWDSRSIRSPSTGGQKL